jgi:hypothetical protein
MEKISVDYSDIRGMAKAFVEIALCPEINKESFTVDELSAIESFNDEIEGQALRLFRSNAARTDRYTGSYRSYEEIRSTTLVGKAPELWLKNRHNGRLQFMGDDTKNDSLYNDLIITQGNNEGKIVEVKTVIFSQDLENPGKRVTYDRSTGMFLARGNSVPWSEFENIEINLSNRFPTKNVTTLKDLGVYGVSVLFCKIHEKLKRVKKEGFYKADFVSMFTCNDFKNPTKWWYLTTLNLPTE